MKTHPAGNGWLNHKWPQNMFLKKQCSIGISKNKLGVTIFKRIYKFSGSIILISQSSEELYFRQNPCFRTRISVKVGPTVYVGAVLSAWFSLSLLSPSYVLQVKFDWFKAWTTGSYKFSVGYLIMTMPTSKSYKFSKFLVLILINFLLENIGFEAIIYALPLVIFSLMSQ